jgi:hypothetical protein
LENQNQAQKNLTLDAMRPAKRIISPGIQEKQVHNIARGLLNSTNKTCVKLPFFKTLAMKYKFFMLIKNNDKPIIKSLNCEKRKT